MRGTKRVIWMLDVANKWWVPKLRKFVYWEDINGNACSSCREFRKKDAAEKAWNYATYLIDRGEGVWLRRLVRSRKGWRDTEWLTDNYESKNKSPESGSSAPFQSGLSSTVL